MASSKDGLYTLLYSLGFNISIDVYSHNNSFILKINENTKINENIVKKIINLKDTSDDQFVYDIETESGRFLGGVGKIILKNCTHQLKKLHQGVGPKFHDIDHRLLLLYMMRFESDLNAEKLFF